MISILIPVFNTNVTAIARALQQQVSATNINVEIIVMDDGSDNTELKAINKNSLAELPGVAYIELPANSGRNIIRHTLAAAARYDTLIFLDADSSFPDMLWLRRYIDAAQTGTVVMGGRLYNNSSPKHSSLHFRYGQLREQGSAARRNKFPWRSFLACNFLIRKQQLSQLIIDDNLTGYCHEDTFMGLQFEKLVIPVLHIDNPVYHDGIDDDSVFMRKQQEALKNLWYLYQAYHNNYNFSQGVRLIRVHNSISATAMGRSMLAKISKRESYLRRQALKTHGLLWLDAWKLAVYNSLSCATVTK